MPLRSAILLPPLLAVMALLSGCGADTRSPTLDVPDARPSVQKYLTSDFEKGTKRYKDALRDYRAYMAGHPEDLEGHLECGMLLADMEKYGEALFHLELYRDNCPDSGKKDLVETYIRKCNAVGAKSESSEGNLVDALRERNLENAQLQKSMETLQTSNQVLVAQMEQQAKRMRDLERRLSIMTAGGNSSPTAPARSLTLGGQTDAPSASPSRKRMGNKPYDVQKGDTLAGIAKTIYGNDSYARDLREANRGKIGPNDKLTEGTTLICP